MNELETINETARPPESWTTYARLSIARKTSIVQGENPYQVTSPSLEDARSALAEAEGWLRPASMEALARVLGELYLRTARRAEESIDRQAVVMLYARELMAYPRDIALDAIRRYRGKFFPALDELREPIERDARLLERRQRIAALKAFVASWGMVPPKSANPPTETQRAKVRAWLADAKGEAPAQLTDAEREALERVDAAHGEKAHGKSGVWKRPTA